jgi:hypothetical protein
MEIRAGASRAMAMTEAVIFSRGQKSEVCWTNAMSDETQMIHRHAFGYRRFLDEGPSMSFLETLACRPKQAIAFGVCSLQPQPTIVGLIDTSPKALIFRNFHLLSLPGKETNFQFAHTEKGKRK